MTRKIFIPSPRMRRVIHHYEYYTFGQNEGVKHINFYPSFVTGLTFLFYQGKRIYIKNETFEKAYLPEKFLIPPTTIPTINYQIENLSVFRVVLQPGVFHTIFDQPLYPYHNNMVELDYMIDKAIKYLYEEMQEAFSVENWIGILKDMYLKNWIQEQ